MNEPELKKFYKEEVVPALQESLGLKNVMQIPKLEKIVLNSGIGSSGGDKTVMEEVLKDMTAISGQKAVITKARKSISNFKLREGMPVGVKVTLRGNQMWEFLYRLIKVSLPLIRDFRGIGKRMDGRGNYTLGISDNTIFPEINVDGHKRLSGLDICIVTTAQNDKEGLELLTLLGMPFRKQTAAQ